MSEIDLTPHLARIKARIGTARGPVARLVERGAMVKFARAIGETNPLYVDPDYASRTRFGDIIAPPTYVSSFSEGLLTADLFDYETPLKRRLHSDDAVIIHQPIRPGDLISGLATLVDAHVRPGRAGPLLFQIAEMILTDGSGDLVASVRVASVCFD